MAAVLVLAGAAGGVALARCVGVGVGDGATGSAKGRQLRAAVAKYREQLIPSEAQLAAVKKAFKAQLESGLHREVPTDGKHMLMLPTYVMRIPNGDESGGVYAIDMGGTNFRVMYAHLGAQKSEIIETDSTEVAIPKAVYTGSGMQLFDFLAEKIVDFMRKHPPPSGSTRPPVLGVCFSFPMKQHSLNSGILLDWTKGFTCDGVVGKDPVALLQAALARAGETVRCSALLNDTVGVLAAQRYLEPSTSVGVILGTGTNACYVEKAERLTKWVPSPPLPAGAETAVNIEWGAFDCDALPRCAEDQDVDAATVHKGKYMFEKLLSGMFLGEVARRIMLSMASDPGVSLFGGCSKAKAARSAAAGTSADPIEALKQRNVFGSPELAACASDRTLRLQHVRDALRCALGVEASYVERRAVRDVCLLVAQRSADLVAAALHALLTHMRWTDAPTRTGVVFDGGVYVRFGRYRAMLERALRRQMGRKLASRVVCRPVHDGSCLGAAVLAAAAAQMG